MIRGLLFDLDGVLVNTNPLHARAWQELAEELGIPFTPADQEAFLGISRAQCLEILLKKGNRSLSESEKERLCTRKNDRYRELIGTLTPAALLPGVSEFLRVARAEGYRTALGSVSKNAEFVLKKLEITAFFDAVIDGRVVTNPDVVRREAMRALRIVASDDYDTFGALDMMRAAPCAPVGADGEQQQR